MLAGGLSKVKPVGPVETGFTTAGGVPVLDMGTPVDGGDKDAVVGVGVGVVVGVAGADDDGEAW